MYKLGSSQARNPQPKSVSKICLEQYRVSWSQSTILTENLRNINKYLSCLHQTFFNLQSMIKKNTKHTLKNILKPNLITFIRPFMFRQMEYAKLMFILFTPNLLCLLGKSISLSIFIDIARGSGIYCSNKLENNIK